MTAAARRSVGGAPAPTPGDTLLAATVAGQLTLVVARDDAHKARLLRALPATDAVALADDDRDSSVRAAIAALRASAAELLDESGAGCIARLVERLHALGDELSAARVADETALRRIEASAADGDSPADLAAEVERVGAERARWDTLLRLWPDWLQLQDARLAAEPLAPFARLAPDTGERWAAAEERETAAEAALGAARQRVARLRRESEQARTGDEPALPRGARDVLRLCGELPTYRARLLELAAARARLAEAERTLAAVAARLGPEWDAARRAQSDPIAARAADLRRWQAALSSARAMRAAAERRRAAAQTGVRDLCERVNGELADAAAEGDAPVDARWRALWRLRAALEEIWDVQSRAESNARALDERAAALEVEEATRPWAPWPWLLGTVSLCTGLAVVAALWSALLGANAALSGALGGGAALLLLLRAALHVCVRWADLLERRHGVALGRLRGEIDRLRRRRDAAWARAAELGAVIDASARHLALALPVTLEAVEACEQELAAGLRGDGAPTPLTASLLALLGAQDEEQRTIAALDTAQSRLQALEHDWQAWRAEVGLPADLDVERLDEWLSEWRGLEAAHAAREAARTALQGLEPLTATFEDEARALLRRLGVAVAPQLCGSALAGELAELEVRARRERQLRRRRARLAAALREAEQCVAEAEAELARARAARAELLAATGNGDEAALRQRIDGYDRWRRAQAHIARSAAAIEAELAPFSNASEQLAGGACAEWSAERERCDRRLADLARRATTAGERQREIERQVAAAGAGTTHAELRLEREEVLAELAEVARAWKLRVLAVALVDGARHEHLAAEQHQLLRAASPSIAALTDGRYTALVRAGHSGGIALLGRDGRREPLAAELGEPLLTQVRLSLLLGWARHNGHASARPVVLDDALARLSADALPMLAREIAALVRVRPVCYVTTFAGRARIVAALGESVAIHELMAQ